MNMNNLPTTREEQILKLARQGVNRNFLKMEANKINMDYDEDTKDEFNRNVNQNEV